MGLFGALEANKPFDIASTITGILKMLVQQELLQRYTPSILQITCRNEHSSVLYVVHVLRPTHVVVLSMVPSVIHVMHHVHVGF